LLRYRDATIRQKLLLTVMVTAGLALLLACTAFVTYDVITERRALATRVETMAEILGIHTAPALTFSDEEAAEETLAALGAERDVLSACLFDPSGKPFASFVRGDRAADCRTLSAKSDARRFEGQHFELVHWIEADGERAGAIQIRWDSREVRERIQTSVAIVLGVLGLTALAGLLIASRLHRDVTVPLAAVVEGSEALARGDLSVAVDAARRDEIGVLARSFNSMAGSLKGLVSQVRENILAVSNATESLERTGRAMASESRRQESVVEETSRSIATMGGSIDSVNENVARLEESARETAGSIVEMDSSVSEIAHHMDNLASAIDVTSSSIMQLTTSIREIAENMAGLDRATETTSASLTDLHASAAVIGSNAEACHSLTQNAAKEAEHGRQSVKETIVAMHEIRASFTALQEVIGELSRKSDSIGEIVQVIEGVAEETNLLSLNAAIIAAQANEHGKAFSVVASSVKSLAERTARSTREIASLIASVQEETRKAVDAMEENGKRVEKGVGLSNQAGEGLRRIMESADQSAGMVREIVENSAVQGRDLAQVDRAMAEVKEIVTQIDRSIREQENASGEIAQATEKIRALGQQVKGSTEEQRNGSKLITRAMEKVMSMIEHILASTREQATQSERIRRALESFREVTVENARRADELGETVTSLSQRSNQLEREINRFTL
jgi:methyl-accepting chemotaxis protein